MVKVKKYLLCGLSCVLVFCIGLYFAGCGNKEEKKYDVTIKVKNNFGNEWIFTPDINELTYEFEYTGEEMRFGVDSYNLPDHPDWGDKWFGLTGEGPNVFKVGSYLYGDGEKWTTTVNRVLERGNYCICIEAMGTSDLWNYRAVYGVFALFLRISDLSQKISYRAVCFGGRRVVYDCRLRHFSSSAPHALH